MKSEQGFAMADALIAMIVASLFATSLFAYNSLMARSVSGATARLHATLLAKSLLDDGGQSASGEREFSSRTFSWVRAVRSSGNQTTRGGAYRKVIVDVSVEWEGSRSRQAVSLSRVRLEGPDA